MSITTPTGTNTPKTPYTIGANQKFGHVAPDEAIARTVAAFQEHNINVIVVEDGAEAKAEVLKLIPHGAHVFTTTSATLEQTGIAAELNDSGNYHSIRKVVVSMDRKTEFSAIRKLTASQDYVVSSVHALTETGSALIASGTGSQLPASAAGAEKVIWVVGAQKIVRDLEEGMKRIYEYSLPLESERLSKAYGKPTNSSVNKILIVNREFTPGRITIILVKENLGF